MQNLSDNIKNSGLSFQLLAKRSSIESERIHAIAEEGAEPTLSEIRKLSKALRIPTEFLLSNAAKFPELNVLFRQSYNQKSDQYKVDKITYLIGSAFQIIGDSYLETPVFHHFPVVDNTFKNARQLAGIFRQVYCENNFIEPLLFLPRVVAENLKCIVFVTDLGSDIDGASAIVKNVPFIFIAPRFEPRMLFTLAHELAHIISHLKEDADYLKIDGGIAELGRNRFKDEAFANAFASELLMPEEGVGYTLKSIREKLHMINESLSDIEIIYLSRIYGVSFDVAAKRCEDLNLLPKGGAASLSEAIKRDFGTAEKRADALEIRERPKIVFPKVSSVLLNAAIDKIQSGEISIGKVSEILSIPMDEILNVKNK